MIRKLALRVSRFCASHAEEAKDIEIYAYGLECIFMEILGDILLFTLALLFDFFLHSLLWTIGLVLVRFHAGGYHAKTPVQCLFISTVSGFLSAGSIRYLGIHISVIFYSNCNQYSCFISFRSGRKPTKSFTENNQSEAKKEYPYNDYFFIKLFYFSHVLFSLVDIRKYSDGIFYSFDCMFFRKNHRK